MVTVDVADIHVGQPQGVKVNDELSLVVCAVEGAYFAFDARCPHKGAPLGDGSLLGNLLVCPLHHFKFELRTGRCVMPRHLRLRGFPVTREGSVL
jgi:nitrite reductase/ring-hydroxylating ferredoxin subunit